MRMNCDPHHHTHHHHHQHQYYKKHRINTTPGSNTSTPTAIIHTSTNKSTPTALTSPNYTHPFLSDLFSIAISICCLT
eukprot:m.11483 g.11483  ORF g.11483 m.11483 type:complete len:78 (+) comp8826_c0_seq1:1568-1801(+)